MSTQPAAATKSEEPEELGEHEGSKLLEEFPQSERAAVMRTVMKLTKTKELFFHFEIGFKRTAPAAITCAAEVHAPPAEHAVAQSPLAFPAGAPRQAAAAPAPDAAVAQPADGGAGSGSTQSGGAVYLVVKGGSSQCPPDGYPPPPR